MPLVRAEVRNEYALGNPELYRAAARREDSKGVLDGVAVSGLVGILRQLGDLAGFASEIFHDLHEQVVATSARGHRMMARVQRIETTLPQIEKAIQVQKSHIHFAYLPGSDWHTNTHVEHEQLLSCDLPRFIMDSYEECREPPRLFLLDKFDRAGPGACLKRYSDPTYFKRVHASSEKLHHEKTQKERKAHKIKRKSSRMLNREMQHAILLSCQTNSIPCASPGSDVQSVAGETVSSSDMRLKSDLGSRSASFDSRTRSSYEEPVSNTNSTAEARGAMFGEPCASRLKIEDNDECASLTADERNSSVDGDSFHNSLQEQRDLRSPSVTWDEKTEIFKPNSPQACDDDIVESRASPESSTVIPDQGVKEQGIINSVQSVQDDISICVPKVPHQEDKRVAESFSLSLPGVSHYEEVTSETDNYVDALNTMESETDTDSEFQTKHEVKAIKASCIHTCHIENGPYNKKPDYSNSVPDDISCISESLQHKETTPGISNLFPVNGRNCSDPLPISGLTYDESVSAGHDLIEIEENSSRETSKENETTHPPSAESDIQDMQAQSSGNPPNVLEDKNVVDTHNTTENCGSSDLTRVKIWTNGGLLGVKPSKPRYFAAQLTASQNSTSSMNDGGDEPICGSTTNHEAETTLIGSSSVVGTSGDHQSSDSISSHMGSNRRRAESEVQPVCPFKPSLSRNGYSDSSRSFRESIPDYSEIKHGKFQKSQSTNLLGCNRVVSNSISNGTPQCSTERLSDGLAETSLPSNLQKEALISQDERQCSFERSAYSTVPMKERSFLEDPKQHPRAPAESRLESNGKQGITSRSLSSGPPSPPSPPLEHMKISFHPVNGTMTSQLKLEFPEGHLHERIEELMFPSFQLHPGDAASMQHLSSESDDDTFCMSSSPYCSEHILSHHSDSDFDTWEQEEEIENGNDGTFGASHTVSSLSASIPCTSGYYQINHHYVHAENEGNDLKTKEDNIITLQSCNLPDLPYLEALKPTLNNQAQSSLPEENTPPDSKLESTNDEMQSQPAPPPPLPPPQWRITKPLPYLNYGQHGIETSDDLMPLQSQASIKPESKQNTGKPVQPSPPPQPPMPPLAAYADKPAVRHTKSMSESVKPYATKRAEQVANVKEPDERDDLLQQIRSKSFNLRRTATMKQSFASGPSANGKVAAIIEKANAIRQVVGGSDEGGEDSTWSDS